MGKKTSKKESKQKKAKSGDIRGKALGLILGLVGVFLLVFVLFYTISRILRPADLATMLPKNSVVAFAQINVNPRHEQVDRFYQSMSNHEVYKIQNVISAIEDKLDTDFEKEIEPWIGRQVGLAYLEKTNSPGELEMLMFFEVRGKDAAIDFMQSRSLQTQEDHVIGEEYNGTEIYRYALSQTLNFIFIDNHLIIGQNEDVLKTVIDANKSSKTKLIDNPSYQKVSQNLPINTLMFAYVDYEKGIEYLKDNDEFMSEKGRQLLAFEPFLKLYKSFGMTLIMENGDLAMQTFTYLDQDYLEGRDFLNFERKYRANLLRLIPEDITFFAGGLDIKKQTQRMSEIFSIGGEPSYLIFEGMIAAQKNKYLGQEIKLEEDIYPLLQGEYALAKIGEGETESVMILLELEDPVRDRDKVESIADSFIRKGAILSPKIVEKELEDGTTYEEIQTIPEDIVRSTEDYHGYEMNVLTVGTKSWGVFYIILDDTLVIATQKDRLKEAIDLSINGQGNVRNSEHYRDSIAPVLRTSDEVLFVKFDGLTQMFADELPEWTAGYLKPFSYVSSGKNYFDDGISTIHHIKID